MATFRDDLLQRDLEAYEEAINDAGIADLQGASRIAGAVVRAAAAANWFTDVKADDVGNMSGKAIRALMRDVNERYEALTSLDPL